MGHQTELEKLFFKAKKEGRLCRRCGWIINKSNWDKGFLLCAGCWDALKGVNVPPRWGKWRDEPVDRTGEYYFIERGDE